MLEILTVGYLVGIVLAIAGGVTFGLWPKPSLVDMARAFGAALAVASFLLTASFTLYFRYTQHVEVASWFWWMIAFVPSLGVWFICAAFTDRATGGHFFGRSEDVLIVEPDPPTHIDLRV